MLLTEKETRKLCQQVMQRLKADDALVTVRSSVETNQRFAANSFSTNGHSESTSVDITAWVNGRKGSAGTSELSDGALIAAVREAERIARLSPKDQEYVPTLEPQTYRPVKAFYESTANPSPRDRARSIDRVIKMCEEKSVIGAGLHRTVAVAGGTLSQRGNFDYERRSTGSLSLTARTPDGTSSGYYLRSVGDLKQLDTDHIAQESIRRAVEGRKAETIAPGVYPVILEAQAVHDILSFFAGAFSARPADEGRSAMSATGGKSKLGEKVFDERINFYSDPWNEELPGSQSAPDGMPAQKIYLVRNGVVENLVYSRYWAKEKGKEPTPGPVNHIIESSSTPSPLAQMISGSERALLVSRLWYIRMVNPRRLLVTGLTRDGVWLIENGKIKHPVRNFRFNQSLMEMLAPGNVEAIGKSERVGGASGFGNASLYPALKLKKFHFTSASEAV